MLFSLKRFVSHLVLFSFFFQTLWPSVVFANTYAKDKWDDHQGLTLKVRRVVDHQMGKRGLRVYLSDTLLSQDDEGKEGLSLSNDKETVFLDKTVWFPSQLKSRATGIYDHLEAIAAENSQWGYWEHEGLGIRVDQGGNIVLLPAVKKALTTALPTLRVKTMGLVGIAPSVSIAHLKVRAQHVFSAATEDGKKSFIERLGVWAKGDGKQAGTLMVVKGSQLEVQDFTLYEGQVENQGLLSVAPGGFIQLNHQNLANDQQILLGEGAKIKDGGTVSNYGLINGEDYLISSAILHNDSTGKMEGGKASLLVQELFVNNGTIATQQKTNLVVFGSGRNLGTIKSQGQQFIAILKDFYNRGTVWASQQTLRVSGKTVNEGKIKGQELTLVLKQLHNHSLIHAGKAVQGTVGEGRNSGLIRSKGLSSFSFQGDFINERFIESAQECLFDIAEGFSFLNQGQITSQQKLTFTGKGQVENKGVMESKRETLLQNAIFHNFHVLKAQDLRIATGQLLHNHTRGLIHSQGQTTLLGEGKIINEAKDQAASGDDEEEKQVLGWISAGNLVFENFTGCVENNGLIYSLQKITGHVKSLHSHHRMQAEQGYDLTVTDFLNTGNWTGQGKLQIVQGKNAGWLATSKLAIEVQDRFEQEATGTLKVTESLTLKGPGKVTNGGLINTPALTVGTESFENTQRLIAGEVKVLPSTKKFSQTKDAFMEAQTVEFVAEGRTDVTSHGNWLITRMLKGVVGSWKNLGKVVVEGDPTFNSLTVLGRLITTKESHWEWAGVKLDVKGDWVHEGVLCLRGNSSLTAQILRNQGKIGRAEGVTGLLDLVVGTLENRGALGFYNLNLTVKDKLTTTDSSQLSAAERLTVHYDKTYEHYGSLSAKELTFTGKGYNRKLINKGTLVSSQKTLIDADFENPEQGIADLTGLTIRTPLYESEHFYNEGQLTLRRVRSLGTKTKQIHNGKKGTLTFLDNGYGVLKDRRLIGSGLTFKEVDNYGTIAFGRGTYWVEEVFRNRESGTAQTLKGQDLWCGDMVNDGLTYAEQGLRVDQTRSVFTKLGKIKVGKEAAKADLILELGPQTAAAEYIQEQASNWDIQGTLRLEVENFFNTKVLGLGFPVYITARNSFENISKIHAKELHIKAGILRQGRMQNVYNDEWGDEEINPQLGELKSDGALTAEVEGDLDNQLGKIEAQGDTTLTSSKGKILNGHSSAVGKDKAVISSGKKLTLKGVEVINHYGEWVGNGGLDITGTQRIHNHSGIIRVQGSATFRGPLFHNQKPVPYRDGSGGGWYGANFDNKYCYVPVGEASQLLVTANIYFLVDALINEASHVTSFGLITDKYGNQRTRKKLGYFQHIDRLVEPQYGAVKGCNPNRGQATWGGRLEEKGSFSSSTWVDFHFEDNRIIGAKLAAGKISMGGKHLLVTDGGMTKGGGERVMPRTVRKSLYPALKQLAGGDIQKQARSTNPLTVYSSQTAAPKTFSLQDLTLVATEMAQATASHANEEQKRVLMDSLSLIFSLQSTLSTTWGRGYIFSGKNHDTHLSTLLKNAKELLKGKVALTRREAEQSSLPLLTFEEEDIDGEKNVLVPYVTLPAHFQNIFLLSPGAVIDSDTTIDSEMEKSITTQSSTVHGIDDVRLYTEGKRVSETLKDTSVIQDGKTTIIRDVARQQDRVISDHGKVTDQSRGDFLSRATYRQGAKGVTMGSTHANTSRLPLELFEQSTTRLKSSGFWGSSRTVTEQRSTALTDQVRVEQGDLTVTSGREAGQQIHEKGTRDTVGGNILYSGHSLLKEALIQVNSIHTQASGLMRQSSAHHETASKLPTTSLARGNIILDLVDQIEVSGWHISAHDMEDYARESHFGALVKELKQMRSKAGIQGAGYTAATTIVEHDTMIPTIFNLSGQYRAYARTEADREGYVLWQAVIANIKGGLLIERCFLEKAADLKVKTTKTTDRGGLTGAVVDVVVDLGNGRNPFDGLGRNFLDTTTKGGIKAYEKGEDDQDRLAAGLRTANSIVADIKDLTAFFQKKDAVINNVLARMATVGLGVQTSHSSSHQITQVPNQVEMEGDAQVLGPEWDHGQGARLKTTKRIIAPNLKRFSMSPAIHQVMAESSSANGGISYNFITQGIGVDIGGMETTHTSTQHELAVMEAGQDIFIRTEKLENTGGRGTGPIVDLTIGKEARHETPVDTEKITTTGAQISLSSSLFRSVGQTPGISGSYQDQTVEARRLAAEKSGFVATQQFYYTVGGVSHEISAEMGLKPSDQIDVLTFKTQRGETFYHRPMPVSAADSTLYALFSAVPSMAVNPRDKVVAKLLQVKTDLVIRQLVAQDMIHLMETAKVEFDEEDQDLTPPAPLLVQAQEAKTKLQPLYRRLMKAVKVYNAAYPGEWLTPEEILTRNPQRTHTLAQAVRLTMELYQTVLTPIQAWAQTEETYQTFIQHFIANSQYGIFPRPLQERIKKNQQGVIDALAQLYGLNVVVYEPTNEGTLASVYEAKPLPLLSGRGKDKAPIYPPVNLLLAAQEDEDGDLQPHMDRLEGEREKIQVGQRIIQHHPEEAGEILKKSGIKLVAPIGEIMLLIDNVKHLRSMMIEEMQDEGVSLEDSVEAIENPELQDLSHEIAKVTKEIDQKLAEQQLKQAAFKSKPSSGSGVSTSSSTSSSSSPVDPTLYDVISRRAQVDLPLSGLPLGTGKRAATVVADQPSTYGHALLEGVGHLKDRVEQFIEKNPKFAGAGEVLLTSLGYCLESAVILKAGIDGAAAGAAMAGRYGALAGGILGMTAAYGAGQALAKGVEKGAEKLVETAATHGRTGEESSRFARTAEWTIKSAMTLALLAGVRKAAVKWRGKEGTRAAIQMPKQEIKRNMESGLIGGRPASSAATQPLLRNQLIAEQIAKGHALEKHVVFQGEFPGWIRTREQLRHHVESVLNDPSSMTKKLGNGKSAYYHNPTNTIVIHNPAAVDGGTVFQPRLGEKYFHEGLN